jgi:hypothetical protein
LGETADLSIAIVWINRLVDSFVKAFGRNVCPERKICQPYGWQIFLKFCDILNRLPKRFGKRFGKTRSERAFYGKRLDSYLNV